MGKGKYESNKNALKAQKGKREVKIKNIEKSCVKEEEEEETNQSE